MTCFQRLLSQLASTGLYRLTRDLVLYAEVKAYAAGFELLLQQIQKLRYGPYFQLPQCPNAGGAGAAVWLCPYPGQWQR